MAKLKGIEAYEWLKQTKKLGGNKSEILMCIMKYPELTDREIAEKLKIEPHYKLIPRRTELFKAGIIKVAGRKCCSVSGKIVNSWEFKEVLDTTYQFRPINKMIHKSTIISLINKSYFKNKNSDIKTALLKLRKKVFRL
jgi:predicted transcriptional regulator